MSVYWRILAFSLCVALLPGCGHKGKLKTPTQIEEQEQKKMRKEAKKQKQAEKDAQKKNDAMQKEESTEEKP